MRSSSLSASRLCLSLAVVVLHSLVQRMARQQYADVPPISIDGDTAARFVSCPLILEGRPWPASWAPSPSPSPVPQATLKSQALAERVLAEVLKNAYRAVLERRATCPVGWKPQLEVQVCDGEAMARPLWRCRGNAVKSASAAEM